MSKLQIEMIRKALKEAKKEGKIKKYLARSKDNGAAYVYLNDGSMVHTNSCDDTLAFLSVNKTDISNSESQISNLASLVITPEMIQEAHEEILAAKAKKKNMLMALGEI